MLIIDDKKDDISENVDDEVTMNHIYHEDYDEMIGQ